MFVVGHFLSVPSVPLRKILPAVVAVCLLATGQLMGAGVQPNQLPVAQQLRASMTTNLLSLVQKSSYVGECLDTSTTDCGDKIILNEFLFLNKRAENWGKPSMFRSEVVCRYFSSFGSKISFAEP